MVVLKQFQKNLFHMLRSLARILWDTGFFQVGKSCFLPFITNFLIDLQGCFLLFPIENYISLTTFGRSKHKILNITIHM